jgi:histidinol dehydrogenase
MRRLDTRTPEFASEFSDLVQAARETTRAVDRVVAEIIASVRSGGDAALCACAQKYDGVYLAPAALRVTAAELDNAEADVPASVRSALDVAARRIETFHRAQMPADLTLDDPIGMRLGMRWTPLDAVGLYVPGGKAAYPSSVLMNAVPARVAGVARVAMCVPAPGGHLNPLVLAAARRAGIDEIYRVGGAHAVAALAFGTASIAPVDRIVGPGNAYVAEAKRQVFGHVGIDSIAGPSEVVVVADSECDPLHVAMDLLAQAEHDEAAQSILITDSADLAESVAQAVAAALPGLAREDIARASWDRHGAIVLVRDWDEAAWLVDRLAPEHLQLMLADPDPIFRRIRHAGAVFLGRFCPEALGDYVAGPNHVLPTGRTARFASGLSVYDFLKRTTWIDAGPDALGEIGPAAVVLAEAEGLYAHARSIALRLQVNEG